MKKTEPLGLGTLCGSVLCQSIFLGMRFPSVGNAKGYFFAGFAAATLYAAVIALLGRFSFGQSMALRRFCSITAVFAAGATVYRALALTGQIFSGSAGWLLLFFGVFFAWRVDGHALNCAVWVIRWLCAGAGILLFLGVFRQLEWQNLSFVLQLPGSFPLWFYPEYLALAFLLPDTKKNNGWYLPYFDFTVRFAFVLLTELVFGASLAAQLEQGELLRAWGMGIFSRFDSFLLVIWLMLALMRTAVLAYTARCLWKGVRNAA